MKAKILRAMQEVGGTGVSFAELSLRVEGFDGEHGLAPAGNPNTFVWARLSLEAVEALEALLEGGFINARITNPLTYVVDGRMLQLPIARNYTHKYKRPHWAPTVLSIVQIVTGAQNIVDALTSSRE